MTLHVMLRYHLLTALALLALAPVALAQGGPDGASAGRAEIAQPAPSASSWHKAEVLLKQLLAERERTLGKDHPLTLATATNLALVYKAQGRYAEARQLYSQALEASERTLGKDHPFTQATAKGLALVYQRAER